MNASHVKSSEKIRSEVPEASHIPYMRHVTPEVIKTFNGDYVVSFRLIGMSHETKSDNELDRASLIRKELFNAFSGKPVQFYTHIIRREIKVSSKGKFDDPFLEHLNNSYKKKFKNKNFFINEIYLTLVRVNSGLFYKSQNKLSSLVENIPFLENLKVFKKALEFETKESAKEIAILDEINDYSNTLVGSLRKYNVSRLTIKQKNGLLWSEPMTLFGYIINKRFMPYKLPSGPINGYLPVNRKFFGHKKLAIKDHDKEIKGVLLTIKNYCNSTFAGMLDNLTSIGCEMVLTSSWQPMDRTSAIKHIKTTSNQMKQGDDAVSLRSDLNSLINSIASGDEVLGTNHLSLFLYHSNDELLDECVGIAIDEFRAIGVDAQIDPLNLECAFWAQLPGNKGYIARKGDITSFNFADISSFHNIPIGKPSSKWGEHILTLTTTAGTPYYLNWHYGDVGIVSIVGGTGSGKTVLMTMGIASTMKFKPKVFYFDYKQGAKIFIKSINGKYLALEPGESTGWNPLQCEDTRANRDFIDSLITMMLTEGKGDDLSPLEKTSVNELVDVIFDQPIENRILRNFEPYVIGTGLSARHTSFKRWIIDEFGKVGEHAWIFDNETNKPMINEHVLGVDMTYFIKNDEIRGPVFNYLFHNAVQSLDGKPVVINIDEAWKAFQDPIFEEQIEEWARTIRRENGVLITGTQKASDASKNRELIEQSKTEIFFPNNKALDVDYKEWLLTDREISLIKELSPEKRYFLLRTPDGSVLVKLDLSGMDDELAVLSGNKETIKLMDQLIDEFGDDSTNWLPEFKKRYRNV